MTPATSIKDVVDELARDPLRHVVLLKHLLAYPEHVTVHRVANAMGAATLVVLEASVSPFDRETYPRAAIAAFISSDHPALSASLLAHVPRGVGIVFKLSRDADLAPVQAQFAVERRTTFVSFTSAGSLERAAGVRVTTEPDDATLHLFETQGHDRSWLRPLFRRGTAFACILERGGDRVSACIAFEIYGRVWEVGGVVTAPSHRRRGLGARVVRTAVAERALIPRLSGRGGQQGVDRARRNCGTPFLTIVHYAHDC
ncbi:MAG TPA: GNAT family N-acetyltransferase [Stellaceae bacterium]|nr:GNAT family N-acetyltransferase [Stellaceae bacterium]